MARNAGKKQASSRLAGIKVLLAACVVVACCDPEAQSQSESRAVLSPPVGAALEPQGPTKAVVPARAFVVPPSGDSTGPPEGGTTNYHPIDLPTALRLAGANNLQIARAASRVVEAQARLAGSQAAWWPSLYGGVGYTRHVGQIQDTRGEVIEVSRSSLFVGGGPALGNSVTGGAGSPRLGVDFSLTDALFSPLVQRQLTQAASAAFTATFNDTLLQVARTYLDLMRAQGQLAIAMEAEDNARKLVDLVGSRVKAGTAPPADGLRSEADLADRRRQVGQAEEAGRVASAELVRLLRLEPTTVLLAVDTHAVPVCFVDDSAPLADLIGQGIASRPEVMQQEALASASAGRVRQEQWRPFLPNLHLGLSAGGFGGGADTGLGNFRDRVDFDALLVWQVQNLGLGNRALRRERTSQTEQAMLGNLQVRDQVAAEVVTAYHQVQFRRRQIDAAREQLKAAEAAVPLNFKGILGDVLRAIEAQQSIQGLAVARNHYLDTILSYNRAQLALWRALGIPLDTTTPGHP